MSGAVWPNGSKDRPLISREYGFRSNIYSGGIHKGIDTVGHTYNHAPEDGRVIYAGYNGQYGNEIRIQGVSGKIHRLGHHKSGGMYVSAGQNVSKGQRIGVQGATGMVTGVHCHWEVRTGGADGSHQDPHAWVNAMIASEVTANVGAGQRTAGSGGVKRRSQPTSQSAEAGEWLSPGTVGNFTGWIRGENVNGNDVWYQGTSGHWFWSGGFNEGANGTGLKDLNQVALAGNQRKVVSTGSSNRRGEPTTASPVKDGPLEPNEIGNFNGWKRGESVNGNDVWFRGTSGDWFWSGGFTDTGTHDLEDLNPKTPALKPNHRVVLSDDIANRRTEPKTSAPLAGDAFPAGTIHEFDLWTRGDSVSGNDVWFRHIPSESWSWSGGFEGGAKTDGLTEKKATVPTPEPTPTAAERTVLADASVNGRTGAGTTFALSGSLDAGSKHTFNAWAAGESVNGISTWFRLPDNRWFWAGGFTSQSTDGLTKVDVPKPPSNQLDTSYKTFKADSKLAKWIGSPNYNWRTPRAANEKPRHITMHWFGTANPKLKDTDNHFQTYGTLVNGRGDGTASNYAVGSGEIHQYIREQDYQQADGNQDSNRYGISIEHEAGPSKPPTAETIELSAQLMADIAERYGWKQLTWMVNVFPHSNWTATQCPGTLPTAQIITRANQILANITDPEPQPEPEPSDDLTDLRNAWSVFKSKMDEYLS
ncbi:endolysin [Microbacterium phage Cece]|nr:endolysin [Microbacterium phage Cece]